MKRNTGKFVRWTAVYAVILVVIIALNVVVSQFSLALDIFFGQIGGGSTQSDTYVSQYDSDGALTEELVAFSQEVEQEAVTLMRNENDALPLEAGTEIGIFGVNEAGWSKVGGGSGGVDTSEYEYITLRSTLEDSGLAVTADLYDYYEGLDDPAAAAWDEISGNVSLGDVSSKTGFFVFSSSGQEGSDLEEGELTLTDTQLDVLRGMDAAGYEKIVLVLNAANPLEMEFLKDSTIRVDAIIWVGNTGAAGLAGIGPVVAGEVNPSGHLVDTYDYLHSYNPVSLNFNQGTETTQYTNAADIEAAIASSGTAISGENSSYYVNYGESIYQGYKYYETRYADAVADVNNANNGGFSYDDQVAFPFGYGLSYGEFTFSNMQMTEEDGNITVSVDVTNEGTIDGKEVVQIYYQAPYTDYDRQNLVEKAAVNLVEFVKTPVIPAGETVTVSTSFAVTDMKSYDMYGERTYIMDEGDYYVTAAHDAHEAVNNIIEAQGTYASAVEGSAEMVGTYTEDAFTVLNTDDTTGNPVTNLFDSTLVEQAATGEYTYLSRQDWSRVDDGSIQYTGVAASDELIANIAATGWNAAGRPAYFNNSEAFTTGADNGLVLADMTGLAYDDPQWDELLDQMNISDMHAMFARAGYTTIAIDSVGKPRTTDYDGPAGLKNYVSGWSGFCYPTEITFAATWNVELLEKFGNLVGEEGLRAGTQGWYAPAMNIHRSPYSGRNFEYYSEDGVLSGILGAAESKGAEDMGMFVYIKHFAVNDAENNRSGINTFMTEQALREIYAKPFELAIKRGGASGVMGSMNRVGYRLTVGSWALMSGLLKNEWGFQGGVVTDFVTYNPSDSEYLLAGGTDLILQTSEANLATTGHNIIRNALRDSSHHTLYMVANSVGVDAGAEGFPIYIILVAVFDILTIGALILGEAFAVKEFIGKNVENKSKKYFRIKILALAFIVLVIAVVGIIAFSIWSSRQI